MRDYKNVKVPKTYRAHAKGPKEKRVDARGGSGWSGRGKMGAKALARRILTLVVIAAGAWLAWQGYGVITRAKMFQVVRVDVEGAKQVREAELKEIVGGITGRNIFKADLEPAIARIRALTWVREARFYRRLPDRIGIVLTERVPAVILDSGRERYLLDGDGTVIDRLKKENEAAWRLPVVTIKGCRVRPGDQVDSEALSEAFALIAEISARGGWTLADVAILANAPESIAVLYADHEFRMGSGNYVEKFRRLGEIMRDVRQRNLDFAYVDLRPERQAAVMVRGVEKR